MSLVLPNASSLVMLKNWLNNAEPQNATLKLFKNNLTPNRFSRAPDFAEADFQGYVAIVLTGDAWSLIAGAPSHADYPMQTFRSSQDQESLQTIYGYFVVQEQSGELMWAERFPAAVPIINNNDRIEVTPRFELGMAEN